MTTTGLEVKLRAGDDRAEVSRFTRTINEVVHSLKEIDRIYLERATRATWVVADLSNKNGALTVRLEARPSHKTRTAADMLVPASALVDGAARLAQVAEVPDLYAPRTVRRLADIATPRDGIDDVTVATYNGTVGQSVPLSQEVRDHAKQAVREKERSHGTFAGQLVLIGQYRSKKGLKVSFYDRKARRAIDGFAPPDMEEQIHELFGLRVLAGGIVIRNGRGQAIRIEVKRLEQLPADDGDDRPSTDELLGLAPDWLGDLSVDEYLTEVRGA